MVSTGQKVVIQNPIYFRKIRDSGSETLIFGQGDTVFDSPSPGVRATALVDDVTGETRRAPARDSKMRSYIAISDLLCWDRRPRVSWLPSAIGQRANRGGVLDARVVHFWCHALALYACPVASTSVRTA